MSQESERIEVDLDEKEKTLIEVALGHLAQEEEAKDAEAAHEFRQIINNIRDEQPIPELDWHTVWVVLDRKSGVNFPAQRFDENVVAESAMGKIEDAVGEIPEHYKHN